MDTVLKVKVTTLSKACLILCTATMIISSLHHGLTRGGGGAAGLRRATSSRPALSTLPFSEILPYTLRSSSPTGLNSCVLKFETPLPLPVGLPVPYGVKLHLDNKGKSYSPVDFVVSSPSSELTLLVKPYSSGIFGAHLCVDLAIGSTTKQNTIEKIQER